MPFYHQLVAAFRGARARVWAIVSFIEPGFRFPDGTPWWDLLDEQAARGVDVRVLFWRNPAFFKTAHVFLGDADDRAFLDARGSGFSARWDSSGDDPPHCHHQKGYVIDAGEPGALAFVGGMVLSQATLAAPGHHHGLEKHDAFLEIAGPSVIDAEHNFVQRWNQAHTDEDAPPWPDEERAGPLPPPARVPAPSGDVAVQLARTVKPGIYPVPVPLPGGRPCSIDGEDAIFEQYREALRAARRTIYIENQHPGEEELLALIEAALARGVLAVMIVPAEPMSAIYRARAEVEALRASDRAHEHRYGPTFARLESLARHDGFALAALARSDVTDAGIEYREIYTHAKLCIVDGEWLTCGSANLVDLSLRRDHTELNAAVWGRETCMPLLRQLVAEHTDMDIDADTGGLDDRALVRSLQELARDNRARRERGEAMRGGCHALDPRTYALRG